MAVKSFSLGSGSSAVNKPAGTLSKIGSALASPVKSLISGSKAVAEKVSQAAQKIPEIKANVSRIYREADYYLGGYLPSGISTTETKTRKIRETLPQYMEYEKSANEQRDIQHQMTIERYKDEIASAEAKALYDAQSDLSKKAWYEYLGLGYGQGEERLRQLRYATAETQQQAGLIAPLGDAQLRRAEQLQNYPEVASVLTGISEAQKQATKPAGILDVLKEGAEGIQSASTFGLVLTIAIVGFIGYALLKK